MKWPIEKQRRCRRDWFAELPRNIAIAQVAHERGMTVYAMHRAGKSFREIAGCFGVSSSRVWGLHYKVLSRKLRSPAEIYYGMVISFHLKPRERQQLQTWFHQ